MAYPLRKPHKIVISRDSAALSPYTEKKRDSPAMSQHKTKLISLLTCAALCATAPAVSAQSKITSHLRDAKKPSFSRTPAELAKPAISYKGFLISPQLGLESTYIDNVFYTQNGTQNDIVGETTPSVEITKAYRDHTMRLQAQVKNQQYADLSDENNTTYDVKLTTNLQATNALKIPLNLSIAEDTIQRSTPGAAGFTAQPLYTQKHSISTGMDYQFNRLNLKLIGEYARQTFDNGTAKNTGQPVVLSSKDHEITNLSMIGTYTLRPRRDGPPEHAFYAGITTAHQKFDRFLNSSGVDTSRLRSNNSINVLAGFKTNYKDLIIGDIGVGYIWYDYDDNRVPDLDSYDISADLAYLITPKATLNFEASRQVSQDNDFTQGLIRSDYMIGAELELKHNLYALGELTYQNADFINSPREDDTYGAGLKLRYIHSPHLETQFGLGYATKDSTNQSADYDQYLMRFGITGRL